MPYVPLPAGEWPQAIESVLDTAERRWRAILEARPDLAPAIDLQRRLLTLVNELGRTIEAGRLPRLSLPPKYLAAKLTRGVPAFAGEPLPLPVPLLKNALVELSEALAAGGAGETATHIRDAIDSGSVEPGSLLAASLTRNQTAIRVGASHRGLAPDLVWLVAELAVSPFVHALQRTLLDHAHDEVLRSALDGWNRGYCPACGSWPALAEVVSGHRTLRCSFCSSAWELNHYACTYCDESGEPFVTAAPNEERKDRRVEVCTACGGYLKTVDLPELSPFPLLSISDIETTDLDVAAMEHGFARPALKDFATRR
ncbi:MAG TPA: formate dehydrogenase accessory protein FdhE [Vicinamibacterales bacterium]|jgi:FdhE protein|nr:formate dehydrogenase accessory protein FdhE [Vicinamibacterales bacterium]